MGGRFLVASKNKATVKAIEKALKAERHQVIVAANGVAVVDLALDKKPNAVFLGGAVNGLSGLDTARALRALAPTANVPIIFLAENAEEAQRLGDARLPLTDCLTAPFDLAEVKTHAAGGLHTGAHVADLRSTRPENEWMLSVLDPLTQLYHRRYLLHQLAYEARRSARYHNSLAVLLVDVDNLKAINQQFGILTGDSVLIEIGQLLFGLCRNSEVVGRNETQDFLILAPQIDPAGVSALAERIRQTIAEHHFVLEKLDLHVTVSIGAARASGDDLGENLALLGRAEGALTRAKRAGKNRVEEG
jgi:two-component system, cell cycle response regulator